MNQTKKITLSAVSAALATVIMLVSYFPYFTYAVPAVAGLFMMIPLIEIESGWAFASYGVSAVFSLLFAEPESKFLYVFIFGFYPILKALIEKIHKFSVEWLIKMLIFNIAVALTYYFSVIISGISYDDIGEFGKTGIIIFIILCEIVFILYDIAISRISFFYMKRVHPVVLKIFK